jgi:ankyrin repeat protein
MHEALNCCSEETQAILFSNEKLDINIANKKGSRPIHIACYNNSIKDSPLSNVKIFVERGADINSLDSRGASPLLVCCSSGREDIIQYLIEHGADPTCKNSSNQSAFDVCAFHNHEQLGMKLFGPDSPSKRFSTF